MLHGFGASADLKLVSLAPPRQCLLFRWSFPRPQPSNFLVNEESDLDPAEEPEMNGLTRPGCFMDHLRRWWDMEMF